MYLIGRYIGTVPIRVFGNENAFPCGDNDDVVARGVEAYSSTTRQAHCSHRGKDDNTHTNSYVTFTSLVEPAARPGKRHTEWETTRIRSIRMLARLVRTQGMQNSRRYIIMLAPGSTSPIRTIHDRVVLNTHNPHSAFLVDLW